MNRFPNSLRTLAAVLVASAAFSGAAGAAITTIDPDSFALGTDISNAVAGASLSATGATPATSAVFVGQEFGTHVFAHDGSFPDFWGQTGAPFDARLRVDFDTATDFVAVDFIPNDSSDPGVLQAFNSAGVLLDSVTLGLPTTSGAVAPLSISRATADIAYLVAWSEADTSIYIDKVSFNQTAAVPVPAAGGLALLGVGILGFCATRRRKTA